MKRLLPCKFKILIKLDHERNLKLSPNWINGYVYDIYFGIGNAYGGACVIDRNGRPHVVDLEHFRITLPDNVRK